MYTFVRSTHSQLLIYLYIEFEIMRRKVRNEWKDECPRAEMQFD